MVRTVIAIGFIAVVAAGALYVVLRPTIARGDALAALVFEKRAGLTIDCDDHVAIGDIGARFKCRVAAEDGSTAVFDMAIARDGTVSRTLVESTGPRL